MKGKKTGELTGAIFNIERFRLNDGEGIRTALFLKGCNLLCPWCCNPESQNPAPQLAIHRNLCVLCGKCAASCPEHALTLDEAGGRMTVDAGACILCGKCEKICPHDSIEIYGYVRTVSEVVAELKKDVAFFNRSCGGVTVSGGEPAMQADFVRQVMFECKQEGILTALETCGLASWENMWKCCEFCDEILFDIKTLITTFFNSLVASGAHFRSTALDAVKDNVRQLRDRNKNVVFRCVIVPGFNYTTDHMNLVVKFAKETGVKRIDLLPFHQYGRHKYDALNMEYRYRHEAGLHDEDVMDLAQLIEKNGLKCIIGG